MPSDASVTTNQPNSNMENVKPTATGGIFPTQADRDRLSNYQTNEQLFLGNHYEAFNIRIQSEEFNKAYGKLRYVMVNFAGMISKIVADLLFGEEPIIKAGEGGDQEFIDALISENNLPIQFFESALNNSALGDDVFKLRIGKRQPNDAKPTIIIETTTPKIYFPNLDPFNVKAEPKSVELAWVFTMEGKEYLRKEIHTGGKIVNEVYLYEGGAIKEKMPITILGIPGLLDEVDTKIEKSLVVHVPNFKFGNRHFGLSDYNDLESLFFAINNRITKTDNILDKHSDPILMVPPGVMDENGKIKKKHLGVIEIGEGETGKPEYVVWDASLENAFKEIEKLVEFMYMVGEVSPDVLGMGEGVNDSGRALKFKLMRTLAKVNRKKMYYNLAIKRVLLVAQELAKAWNIEVGGKPLKGEPTEVSIDWADGLPIDNSEQIETETQALDAGITTKKAAAMRVYKLDEKEAEELISEKDEENKLAMPTMALGGKLEAQTGENPLKPGEKKPVPPVKPPVSK